MKEKSTIRASAWEGEASVYHIYHTGPAQDSYSVHTISDSNTVLPSSTGLPLNRLNGAKTLGDKVKRGKFLDKPQYDPRCHTSPYYLQQPVLYFHNPPQVLRHGGTRQAPPTGLLQANLWWREYKLEFGDILAQDGVVDGRGVVSMNFGTKDGADGTLKGYKLRKRHHGESGKEWVNQQQQLGLIPPPTITESAKVKAEEIVKLKWVAPISLRPREYRFTWRGHEFIWKGTTQVPWKNKWSAFLCWAHLKLVVLTPNHADPAHPIETVLARYISVFASRKAGRMEVYDNVLEEFISSNGLDLDSPRSPDFEKLPGEKLGASKIQKRLHDVVVATGLCMAKGEWTKRQLIITLIAIAAGAYS